MGGIGRTVIVAFQLRPEAARLVREELASRKTAPGQRSSGHASAPGRKRNRRETERPEMASVRKVLALVHKMRADVLPVHPLATDPVLSTFFTVHVPDAKNAASLAAALLKVPLVAAAYVKPPDEPPA